MKKQVKPRQPSPQTFMFYLRALDILLNSGVPFLVGGAYGFAHYTKIVRHTKDFDIFLCQPNLAEALRAFRKAGYRAEIIFSHWLSKVFHEGECIDLIFNSGNGACPVDQTWFEHAVAAEVLGVPVRVIPVEEMIWQKAYIMERERFDGADIVHLLRARGRQLDWHRLLARFGDHWRVLFSHLVLFGFVYPDDRQTIPSGIVRSLTERFRAEPWSPNHQQVCRGPLLSRMQYLADTESWGYADPRQAPLGALTPAQFTTWTNAGR